MNNNAAQIYQMFRQSPFPGATSVNAISERLDELKKDKRWREEYDLKKKQIESAIGYRDLQKKLEREKADRDRKANEELLDYKEKNLQMGQIPVTAETGLSPYGNLAKTFGGAVSGLPGMGAMGKGLEAFGGAIPETITAKPTQAVVEERRRGLYKEMFPEKVYGKEPRKSEETPYGYKTHADIPEVPGMEAEISTNKWNRLDVTWKKVDKSGEPTELFATFKVCQSHIKKMGYEAVPKRDSKTGKYYPSYKEPAKPDKDKLTISQKITLAQKILANDMTTTGDPIMDKLQAVLHQGKKMQYSEEDKKWAREIIGSITGSKGKTSKSAGTKAIEEDWVKYLK